MARQDKDGFFDPALVAAWRRMLWVMRGSADVLEALAPTAAGMTKDEISRLLARAGAPSGKGVEPVEQVLGLLGVVPRARYDSLLKEHEGLLNQYEELAARVEEAEQNIEGMRRLVRDQGMADEAEQLLDSWGGLVRRTLRAQAGFMRSIANAGGNVAGPALPSDATSQPESAEPEQPAQDTALLETAPPQAPAAGASAPPPATRRRASRGNGTRKSAERRVAPPEATPAQEPEPDVASSETAPSHPAARRRASTTSGTRGGGRRKSAPTAPAAAGTPAPHADQQEPDTASSGTAPARPPARRRTTRTSSTGSGTRSTRTRRPD